MWKVKNAGAGLLVATGTIAHTKSSGVINGPAIERMLDESSQGYNSGFLFGAMADSVGAPTAVALAVHIEDSADGTTDWTDVSGLTHTTDIESGVEGTAVDLTGCRQFIRVVSEITHTGGTSPNSDYHSGIVLAGAVKKPTQ